MSETNIMTLALDQVDLELQQRKHSQEDIDIIMLVCDLVLGSLAINLKTEDFHDPKTLEGLKAATKALGIVQDMYHRKERMN